MGGLSKKQGSNTMMSTSLALKLCCNKITDVDMILSFTVEILIFGVNENPLLLREVHTID